LQPQFLPRVKGNAQHHDQQYHRQRNVSQMKTDSAYRSGRTSRCVNPFYAEPKELWNP